jgi:hypothetical protein
MSTLYRWIFYTVSLLSASEPMDLNDIIFHIINMPTADVSSILIDLKKFLLSGLISRIAS